MSIKQQLLRFGIITCPLIEIPDPGNAWVNSGQLCFLLATIIIVLGDNGAEPSDSKDNRPV